MIKLFASDLDGTLLNFYHETDRAILSHIHGVTQAGAHVALSTGRPIRSGAALGFGNLPIEVVASNGSIIYGADGALLKAFEIDSELIEDMLAAFPQVIFECIAPEGSYITGSLEDWLDSFVASSEFERKGMRRRNLRRAQDDPTMRFSQGAAEALEHEVCKVNCRIRDAVLKRELEAYLEERSADLVNAPFKPVMFEITQRGVNKGAGLAWLAEHFGIEEDEVAVYGDGGNDIEMLSRFRHAYAPANADPEAKRAAGTVIGSNVFHSVSKHMLRTVRGQ